MNKFNFKKYRSFLKFSIACQGPHNWYNNDILCNRKVIFCSSWVCRRYCAEWHFFLLTWFDLNKAFTRIDYNISYLIAQTIALNFYSDIVMCRAIAVMTRITHCMVLSQSMAYAGYVPYIHLKCLLSLFLHCTNSQFLKIGYVNRLSVQNSQFLQSTGVGILPM